MVLGRREVARMDAPGGRRDGAEAALAAVACVQHGAFHCRQATDAGFTAKMRRVLLENGRWQTLYPSVYRLAGTPATWHQALMAACLVAGPGAVASHRSAGALWGLDGLGPGPIEVTFPGRGERHLPGAMLHRTRSLAGVDIGRRDGIPVTRLPRTLLDLASVLDPTRLEVAVDAALRDGHASVAHLLRRLPIHDAPQWPSAMMMGRSSSPACVRLYSDTLPATLLDGAGRAPLVRQYELRDVDRHLVARFDLADPSARVAVEFDSYRHHFGRQAWRRDQSRHNRATSLGWLVFHVTEDDLSGPAAEILVQAVARARVVGRVRREG